MLQLVAHNQFRKDLARLGKREVDLLGLIRVMAMILGSERLPAKYKAHQLKGDWAGMMECHVGGDLLLIWIVVGEEARFVRAGTHSDLFGK